MGARQNPIKFGPEWLRNMPRERNIVNTTNDQNNASLLTPSVANTDKNTSSVLPGTTRHGARCKSPSRPPSSVVLAKLRYGREEMLALYDKNAESPVELKSYDKLYQPHSKTPCALIRTFEERENVRNGPPTGNLTTGERFPSARGFPKRGLVQLEGRGRGRLAATRQLMMEIKKSTGTNTNWRQANREETEEWRSDTAKNKLRDKWGREWTEKPTTDKPYNWTANRRNWISTEMANPEDNLPEWAVDNAEAYGGMFDSSGTFHGYSNDDTILPKTQDTAYTLTRSHTHGSFVRQKFFDEGSEEWWASDKAKKLSSKKFDAGDIKSKKVPPAGPSEARVSTPAMDLTVKDNKMSIKQSAYFKDFAQVSSNDDDKNGSDMKFVGSKTFDSLVRSNINLNDADNETGNFQSVIITPNNSLRQMHQKIGSPPYSTKSNSRKGPTEQVVENVYTQKRAESQSETLQDPHTLMDYKITDNFLRISIDDKQGRPNVNTDMGSINDVKGSAGIATGSSGIITPTDRIFSQRPVTHEPVVANHGVYALNRENKLVLLPSVARPTNMQPNRIHQIGVDNATPRAMPRLPLSGPNNLELSHQNPLQPSLPAFGYIGGIRPSRQPNPIGGTSISEFHNFSGISRPVGNTNRVFMGTNSNNSSLQPQSDPKLLNNAGQNYYSLVRPQTTPAANSGNLPFNIISGLTPQQPLTSCTLAEQWYYEDPKQRIQGPFSELEMYGWYRAGFFSPNLMVRRASEHTMKPLGSYPSVPFIPKFLRTHPLLGEDLLRQQQADIGLNLESLWSHSYPASNMPWMQHNKINTSKENAIDDLQTYFWNQASTVTSNSLLPEGIPNDRETEDRTLAQLIASQNATTSQTFSFFVDAHTETPELNTNNDGFNISKNATPTLEELQKLIQKEKLAPTPSPPLPLPSEIVQPAEQPTELPKTAIDTSDIIVPKQVSVTKPVEGKTSKQQKNEGEKVSKKGEKGKSEKNKKAKEDKKEEPTEVKVKEKEVDAKFEKRSAEPSPSKTKKEEKPNKRELEKEKKELVKEGFTIVKGPEKNVNKDCRKKAEDLKVAEELDRKKKEEDKLAAGDEKKKKQLEILKKQQEPLQHQKQINELVMKKAPWSVVTHQTLAAPNKDGPTLAEIQRLEREKKLEQIKEQQHMMQIIAQQQAAAMAREQEIQAGLGWAKKKSINNMPDQSLADIQAEARKQSVAAALAPVQNYDDSQPSTLPTTNYGPWGNTQNGFESPDGFWDTTQPIPCPKSEKPKDSSKMSESNKSKKKSNPPMPAKIESTPAAEFENWCSFELTAWSSKIDVPTFIGFLKDIESPYEVKDYVKCYLGESKDSSDFARQFLERRSKLLRVGMVTPSDDLCSPAVAVNPRAVSTSEYQEVKGKGKKTKKNKMLKVDSRILGFSVTAAEDRINVGDIDTV